MIKEYAKEYFPLIEAWQAGKPMQTFADGAWHDFTPDAKPSWNHPPNEYRVKPEPQWREWYADEVPIGALIRDDKKDSAHLISGVSFIRPMLWAGGETYSLPGIFRDGWTYSRDGKTWKRCGTPIIQN